jgi:AcrR family transcriptional regulator
MPKKVDHAARREAFLQAAYRVIKKQGFAGVTVRSVAREAGFTTGALVHYVDSMDQLLVEASEYSAREVRDKMLAAEALVDPLISLREVLYLALPSMRQARELELLPGVWELRSTTPRCMGDASAMSEWLKRTARLIQRARRSSERRRYCARCAAAWRDRRHSDSSPPVSRSLSPEQRLLIDEWIRTWLRPKRTIPLSSAPAKRETSGKPKRALVRA